MENNKEIEKDLNNVIGTGRSDFVIFIKWRDYFDKYVILLVSGTCRQTHQSSGTL